MKKRFVIAMICMIALMSTACGSNAGSGSSTSAPAASDGDSGGKASEYVPLTIALPTWTGYGPLFVAKEKGYFEKRGIDVSLKIVEGIGERKQALASGAIQGLATATDVLVNLSANSVPTGLVWTLDKSDGADGIIAKKDITEPAQLKGKRVAVEVGTTSHLFLLKVLEQAGLSEKDIKVIQMNSGDAGAAFVAGKVDAAVTYDPWLSKGVEAGGNAFTTKEYPVQIVDAIGFSKEIIEKHPDEMKDFVAAMAEASEFWKTNQDEAVKIMADGLKISEDDVKATAAELAMFDLEDNKTQMGSAEKPGTIYNTAQDIADFYLQQKIIDSTVDLDQLIDPSFVREQE
ncbi:MAG: ABC transporter substrate-binding protein [Paenibacillus sp.]|uniref:ABC transporter substrate-binding protein n=1 Tax=Paenibacillus sp. TaxID=58172 RepID=UPI00290431B1|nr:ABC transporter substrate-binding protein [Paenibacillus sp.]MDU2240863.1 ABC transporter substrate-binding protein [Paenibacillus sp.]